MPDPNAVVSFVLRMEPPLDRPAAEMLRAEGGAWVEFEDGSRVHLDSNDPRSPGFATILNEVREQRLPVYVETNPDTRAITTLLLPHVTRVAGIRPVDEGVLGVELVPSHARHVLRRSAEESDHLERALREALASGAPVIVTETDAHEIIDVRDYRPGQDRPPLPFPDVGSPRPWTRQWLQSVLLGFWYWRWWPWRWWFWWFRCVSKTKAQQVFEQMQATSCDPLTVPAPCIPFLYPDDGCWARAHEMCRLMIGIGLKPKKVWIQGSLYVSTKNNPNCGVWWGWHVAPTLCVRGRWLVNKRQMVIDPSLFSKPVTKAGWKSVQGDTNATLTDSEAAIYYLWGNVTDPAYNDTNQKLAFYRLQLQNRTVQHGPPPYANCP